MRLGHRAEPPGNDAFVSRLNKIANRGRLELSCYPTDCEPQVGQMRQVGQVRRFWTPEELKTINGGG